MAAKSQQDGMPATMRFRQSAAWGRAGLPYRLHSNLGAEAALAPTMANRLFSNDNMVAGKGNAAIQSGIGSVGEGCAPSCPERSLTSGVSVGRSRIDMDSMAPAIGPKIGRAHV